MSEVTERKKPYISADVKLPEITIKALVLGVILAVLLAGANAYLGLFAGMTVSASIPAAVISMAVLSLFRQSNILENNIVQTAASAGESLAAGVVFTFPALVIMGYWQHFNYWEVTLIALCGGVMGVLFTVPLRNALIVHQKLKYPEGLATAEVLKSGEQSSSDVKYLVWAAVVSGLMKFGEQGMHLWNGIFEKAKVIGTRGYLYFGVDVSPALIAVGYIVGLNISTLVFAGGVFSWWIAIPIYIGSHGLPLNANGAIDAGYQIWSDQIRYIGVGAMVIGGIWALVDLRSSVGTAFSEGFKAFRERGSETVQRVRTEYDTPMSWVLLGLGILVIPIFVIYLTEIRTGGISIIMALLMILAGFLFSAVAGYMSGLVGSSNNPISGITIATILSSALILLVLMGNDTTRGPASAILIGAVVCCAASIAADNLHDLKAGYELGATPMNQQIMLIVGVVASAFVMSPILSLLHTAYGFGPATPAHPNSLTAPQATLMASVAQGVFGGNLPWGMIWIGIAIGAVIIAFDEHLKKKGSSFRMPVLAVAVGIYLPFELDCATMVGGVIAWLVSKYQDRQRERDDYDAAKERSDRAGLLFASGLITGEALMGILLAIPIAYYGGTDVFSIKRLFGAQASPFEAWPGLILLAIVGYYLYRSAAKSFSKKAE
ncbi:MAG TPA: oligopeptide transporter, OPT family [Balneolales bacterium]|nr:oligopeptide transporter, OPT family [Balneolales bacterium]